MPNVLHVKRIREVSLVDKGASGNSKVKPAIVIAKRREEMDPKQDTGWLVKLRKTLFGKKSGGTPLTIDEVLAGLSEDQKAVILAALQAAAKDEEEAEPGEPMKAGPSAETGTPGNAEPPTKKPPAGEAMKRLDPEIRKRIEDGEKAQAEVVELRKRLDKMDDEREQAEFVAKAKDLPYLAGASIVEIAKALRAVKKALPEKEFATVAKVLDSANRAIQASELLKVNGVPGFGADADGNALAQLTRIAKSKIEKRADGALTFAAALDEASRENPELVAEYQRQIAGKA